MTGKRAFYLLNILAVVLSLLTAFGATPVPGIIGISLAFYVLLLLPGILIARIWLGSMEVSVEGMCTAFFSGLVLVSLLVCLAFLPGVSFPALSVAAAAVAILLLSLDLRRRRTEPAGGSFSDTAGGSKRPGGGRTYRPKERAAIVFVLFALVFVFYYGSAETNWGTDAPDHLSFIRRAVDSGTIFPNDSYHKDGDGTVFDPRKGLWHAVMSLWLYQSGAQPAYFWSMLPSFLAFFAMISFIFFATALLGPASYVAFACILLALFYREDGIGWFAKLGYSRNISQIILWTGVSFLLFYYRGNSGRHLALACALTLIGVSIHLAFLLLIVTMLFSLLLYVHFTRWGREWRKRFWRSIPPLAVAAAIPFSVRAAFTFSEYNDIHTHLQGMMMLPGHMMIPDPIDIITRHGLMLFLALPLAVYLLFSRANRERCVLVGTLFLVPVFFVLNPVTATILEKRLGYMLVRLLYAAPTMCLCALALGNLFRVVFAKRARGTAAWAGIVRRGTALAILVLFMLFPARLATRALVIRAGNILHGVGSINREYTEIAERLERTLPAHSVILSDPVTSYIISAYTDHFVAVTFGQHCSPSDTLVVTRHRAVRDILSPAVSTAESKHWLELFRADYILINSSPDTEASFYRTVQYGELPLTLEKLRSCRQLFKEIYADGEFLLFEVEVDSLLSESSEPCDALFGSALPCNGGTDAQEIAYECGVTLVDLELNGQVFRPGDTLSGSFCWRAARQLPFESPIVWALRLDTDFPRGIFFQPWYSKQYRRRIERRNDMYYRFTRFERLMSGCVYPDQWGNGTDMRQDFSFALPSELAPGRYEVRLSVRNVSYMQNTIIADYLMNDDSFQGEPVGMLWIDEQATAHAGLRPYGPYR